MIYLNGKFMPLEEACVPVLDRGFIFGDGVYEVIPAYSRKLFRLTNHLDRLQHSLDGIRLQNPYSNSQWHDLLNKIVAGNDNDDQYIYLHITRGVAKRDHAFPLNSAPTIFIMSNPLLAPPQELLIKGCSAVTAIDNRWIRCDIKSISLLPNILLRQMAVDVDASETILIRDGFLTEGAASSIFIVKDNLLLAPPKSHLMLPGITYDVVLELAATHHIPYKIREITEEELQLADEIMLTSSTKEIMAVTRLNGNLVGDGLTGPLCQQLQKMYYHYKTTTMRSDSPIS